MPKNGNQADRLTASTTTISRRNYLQAAAGSIVVLSGCTSDSIEGDGETSDGSNGDVFITGGRVPDPVEDSNYNPYSSRVRDDIALMRFGFRDHRAEEFVSEELGGPLTDWEYERGNKATLHLKEGLVWQDGAKHTAQDFVTGFQLVKEAIGEDAGIWIAAEGVSAKGDWTIQIDLEKEYNEELFWSTIFGEGGARYNPAQTRDDIFREYLETIQDASSDDAKSEARGELADLSLTEYPPKTGGTVWKPVDHTSTHVEYELFEEHPYAENVNWDRARMLTQNAKEQHGQEYIKSGQLDLLKMTLDESTLSTLPDSVRTDNVPKPQLTTLLLNNQHEYLGRRKVRQAFAHIIDREAAAKLVFPPDPNALEHIVGFGPTAAEHWLDGIKEKLIPYEVNHDKAAKLLEEEGFTQEGGTWITPAGDPFKLQFIELKFENISKMVQSVNPFINEFGIETELISKSGEQMWADHYPNSNYEMTVGPHGGMGQSHPYVSFRRVFDNGMAPSIDAPDEYTYPETIGDLDSSKKTVAPMDLVSQIPTASEEEAIELVQELAWIFNYNLPQLPIMRRTLQNHYDTEDWDVASADTPGMVQSRTAVNAMQNGLISKK